MSLPKINQDLILAVRSDDRITAQKLLVAGADPDTKDVNGTAALALAVRYQRTKMAFILLGNGADPNCKAASDLGPDFTVLMQAAAQGDLPTVYALLASGADIERQSSRAGLTPLMCAATGSKQPGSLAIIKVLLVAGADPNRQAEDGETALMKAAVAGRPEAVETLWAHGAHHDTKDNIGMTAYNHAVFNGHQEVADLLLKYGADPSPFTLSSSAAAAGEF